MEVMVVLGRAFVVVLANLAAVSSRDYDESHGMAIYRFDGRDGDLGVVHGDRLARFG